jgi:hypothetical protein
MSLAGNLRTMALPDILQWISQGRKTGTLHLERRSIQKRLIFQKGSVYTSWSNDPREYLGQYLLRNRKVSEEQLFRALLKQENQGKLIGAVLIAEELLTEDDLRVALKTKAEETIYDLFLWPEGKFEFKDGEVPTNVPIHIDTEVTTLILEGIRRVDEWERYRAVFPNLTTTFKLKKATDAVTDPAELQMLQAAQAGKSMAEISTETRRSEFDTAAILFDLYNRGFIAVDRVEEDAWGADPVGAIKDLLAVAAQRLKEKRFDAALEAYEQVLCFDRLNQNAKKGLIAVIDARDRERALRTVDLDKVPRMKMDFANLTKENFDAQEGFVLSRVNGDWDVRSILKLCPMPEEEALLIFARLLKRKVIEMA